MSAPIPSATAPRVPDAGGDVTQVAWNQAAPLEGPWYDRGQATPSARQFAGRIAHDAQLRIFALRNYAQSPTFEA